MKMNNRRPACGHHHLIVRRRATSSAIILITIASIAIGVVGASFASSEDIQPLNGPWQAVIKVKSVSGCSAEMRREIKSEAKDEVLYSKLLTFPEPLDLNKLNKAWDVNIDWTRNSPNRWSGHMVEKELTLYGKITTVTTVDTRIVSDRVIDQQSVMTISFPPRLARKFGTTDPCVINAEITHRLR
tara:strand:- start:679 stop:1236 length:558 start_codon:yes stop_codon:yes gene_type:complete